MQSRQRPAVKTYLLQVARPLAARGLTEFLSRTMRRAAPRRRIEVSEVADEGTLFEIRVGQLTLWVDTSGGATWDVHSIGETSKVSTLVERWVAATAELEMPWFPEQLLATAAAAGDFVGFGLSFSREFFVEDPSDVADTLSVRVSGSESSDALHQFRTQESLTRSSALASIRVRNALSGPGAMAGGRIASTLGSRGRVSSRGDSFDRHREFFRHSAHLYAEASRAVAERHTVGRLDEEGEGLRGPLVIDLYSPVEDLGSFVARIFSGADPFRLWALLERRADDLIVAEAFDQGLGVPFTVEATPELWRVYLPEGAPGPLALKLVTLLQHHHDRRVSAPAIAL